MIVVTKRISWWPWLPAGLPADVPLIISRLDFTTWKFSLEAGLTFGCINYDSMIRLQVREKLRVQWLEQVKDLLFS